MLLPTTCPACRRAGDSPCVECRLALLPPPLLPPPAGLDWCHAAFAYDGVARELVARLKYRNARSALPWLASVLAELVELSPHESSPIGSVRDSVVTWVPTTGVRRLGRGFDQSELLARAVARRLRWPCRRLLVRVAGPAQTGRSAAERRAGPQFAVCHQPPRSVVLVDDVVTTGATLAVAAAELRAAGAGHLGAIAAARTPFPSAGPSRRPATTMA